MSPIASNQLTPNHPRALVVMARLPRAGRCKTRLSPPLSADDAAGLYRAFLSDIGRLLSEWEANCDLWVAWADDGQGPSSTDRFRPPAELQSIFPPHCRFLRQEGLDLTERMNSVFGDLLEAGYRQVVMRNSDSPHLPLRLLDEAFAALEQGAPGSVVLGPDLDGGYYLVGLDSPPAGLFPTVMSTGSVLGQTVESAHQQQRDIHQLESFLDIDSPDDLRMFWLEFGGRSDVRDWATWRRLSATDMMDHLE